MCVEPDLTSPQSGPSDSLALCGVTAGYDGSVALRAVSLTIPPGSVIGVLGPNGAGKTTLLRVASGLLRPSTGAVLLGDLELTHLAPHERARRGICLVPEGRGVFPSLTVYENLALFSPKYERAESIERALSAFAALGSRLRQIAGSLSGGEQQMLALARAYVQRPRFILLDEVSIGLAPIVVDQIYNFVQQLASERVGLVIVEQYASKVLAIADFVCLLSKGSIEHLERAADIDESELFARYSGTSS